MSAGEFDEVARLIAIGGRAAFHGRPSDGIDPLERAITSCRSASDVDCGVRASWLLGVCLAAMGRYGSAISRLHPMLADVSTPAAAGHAGLAATTIASVNRQINRYSDARRYDEWARSAAVGNPDVLTDAWMGLASDAVGEGDAALAERCLAQAVRTYAGRDEWRTALRMDWVRVEIALTRSDPTSAVEHAQAALERAEAADAPRHVAKSLLFLGASRIALARQTGADPAADATAMSELRRCSALARSLDAQPLVWPAHLLLAQSRAPQDPARQRDTAAAGAAIRQILGDLPAPIGRSWAARPELAAVLG